MSTTSRGPSRRTLVKGAAWSVPVVAVAGAAPAMAASRPLVFVPGDACKLPGNSCGDYSKGYLFPFTVTNSYECAVVITDIVVTTVGTDLPLEIATPITIASGTTLLKLNATSGNSANQTFTANLAITYEIPCRGGEVVQTTASITVPATPPDCPECDKGKDTTPPTAGTLSATEVTPTSATVMVSGAEDETALDPSPYSFRVDGGEWTDWQQTNVSIFNSLTANTTYTIQHRVRDAAGNITEGAPITVTTKAVETAANPDAATLEGSAQDAQAKSETEDPSEDVTVVQPTPKAEEPTPASPPTGGSAADTAATEDN